MTGAVSSGVVAGAVALVILWSGPEPRRPGRRVIVGSMNGFVAGSSAARARLKSALMRADVSWPVDTAIRLWRRAVLVATGLGFLFGSVATSAGAACLAAIGPVLFLVSRGDRRRHREIRELPAAIDVMERSLRSGAGTRQAIADVAASVPSLSESFERVVTMATAGRPLVRALDDWATELDDSDAKLLVAVLEMGDQSGGSISPSLARVAQTIRDRRELADETSALSAQTRLSAMVVAGAPLGFAAFLTVIDPGASTMLVSTPVGRLCLAGGLVLDGIGIWWMKRLARTVQP